MAIEQAISARLEEAFKPVHLEVHNDSHRHRSGGEESHFTVVIVSEAFVGQGPVQRHRAVHAALGDVMGQVHALGLHAWTPEQWAERGGWMPQAAPCPSGRSRNG